LEIHTATSAVLVQNTSIEKNYWASESRFE